MSVSAQREVTVGYFWYWTFLLLIDRMDDFKIIPNWGEMEKWLFKRARTGCRYQSPGPGWVREGHGMLSNQESLTLDSLSWTRASVISDKLRCECFWSHYRLSPPKENHFSSDSGMQDTGEELPSWGPATATQKNPGWNQGDEGWQGRDFFKPFPPRLHFLHIRSQVLDWSYSKSVNFWRPGFHLSISVFLSPNPSCMYAALSHIQLLWL